MSRAAKATAAVVVAGMIGLVAYAAVDDATSRPMSIAGDQLGQDPGESFSSYRERAADSLAAAEEGEESFALITFARPLTARGASDLLSDIERVNTMMVGQAVPLALPEPVDGATRADVFAQQFDLLDSFLGPAPAPYQLTAVTAYDDPAAFRALDGHDDVAAVEVLPPDAMWGNFGIRPATPPGIDMMEVAIPSGA